MGNKKYLDKILNYLVRGTKIDYEKERIYFSFYPYPFYFLDSFSPFYLSLFSSFSKYCRNQFGLTEKEVEYVWKEYVVIMKDKINNGEQ
jgi:hypothetical protein